MLNNFNYTCWYMKVLYKIKRLGNCCREHDWYKRFSINSNKIVCRMRPTQLTFLCIDDLDPGCLVCKCCIQGVFWNFSWYLTPFLKLFLKNLLSIWVLITQLHPWTNIFRERKRNMINTQTNWNLYLLCCLLCYLSLLMCQKQCRWTFM
jgi:hypothetical protein